MSYTTKTVVTAGQGQRDFDIPFPYLDPSHIQVRVAGNPATWSLVNSGRLRLDFPTNAGNAVEIIRHTALDSALVQFQNGAVLTAEDLNKAVRQTLFIQQELTDLYNSTLNTALLQIATANGIVSTDPTQLLAQLAAQVVNTQAIADLQSRVQDITANAQALLTTQTQIANLTSTVNALSSINGQGLQTVIQNETNQRIAGDTALTQTLSLIGAVSGDSRSIVLNTSTCKVSPTQSLGDYITGVAASLNSNLAAIQTEVQARTDAVSAVSSQVTTLLSRMGTAESAITTNNTTLTNATNALSSSVTALTSRMGSAESAILTETNARATADAALTSTFALLGAKTANGQGWILDESKVMVNQGETTLGTRLSGIDTSLNNVSAAIATEQTARSNADSALSSQLTSLQATVSGNTSAISNEITARANADSALAQSLMTLTSTVNGNTATINTLQSTTNGLLARYSVAVNVNGHVSGFVLNSNGNQSNFTVVADSFNIATPNGASVQTPFSVIGGQVFINSAVIQDATISSAKIADLSISTLKLADGAVVTDKLTSNSITKVYSFTNQDFVPPANPSHPQYLARGLEYTICSGTFVKERADSRLRIYADASVWSNNDLTAQLFIRVRPTGELTWTDLIGNHAYPGAYYSSSAGWPMGQLGPKLSDWALLLVSDSNYASLIQAVKTLFVDNLGSGSWDIAFSIRAYNGSALSDFSNHIVQPGAVISVEEIKR